MKCTICDGKLSFVKSPFGERRGVWTHVGGPPLIDIHAPTPLRDAEGYLLGTWYSPEGEAFHHRLTDCCAAAVTYQEETLCCKGCYAEMSPDYDPGGPIRIDLSGTPPTYEGPA